MLPISEKSYPGHAKFAGARETASYQFEAWAFLAGNLNLVGPIILPARLTLGVRPEGIVAAVVDWSAAPAAAREPACS